MEQTLNTGKSPSSDKREQLLSSDRLYDGHILNLRVDKVALPSGRHSVREVVEHKAAVGILAVTDSGSILLVQQYRYPVGEETLEICAGLVEEGEDTQAAAVREMQEELGFKPARITKICDFYSTPGFCTELMSLYLATELAPSRLAQDDDEDVSAVELAPDEIPALLADGRIHDAKTFAALSWFMAWRGLKPQGF